MEINKRAILVLTDEQLKPRYFTDKPKRFVYVMSDDPKFPLRHYQKIHEDDLAKAVPGEYFDRKTHEVGIDMIFPRKQDLLYTKTVGGRTLQIYKIYFCAGYYFNDRPAEEYADLITQIMRLAQRRYELPGRLTVELFISAMFWRACSVRGSTQGLPVLLTTPCRDFFHADVDGIDSYIGGPLEATFGLEQFNLRWGLSSGGFRDHVTDQNFHLKYPAGVEATDWFTLRVFADMIYDLIRIKYGMVADLHL